MATAKKNAPATAQTPADAPVTTQDAQAQGMTSLDDPGASHSPSPAAIARALAAPPGGPDQGTVTEYKAPQADPGPPPPIPTEPEGVWPFGLSRLTSAALARDRATLAALDLTRMPPAVGTFRAHLLEWLDKIAEYELRVFGK